MRFSVAISAAPFLGGRCAPTIPAPALPGSGSDGRRRFSRPLSPWWAPVALPIVVRGHAFGDLHLLGVTDAAPRTTHLNPPEPRGPLRRQRLEWARLYFVSDARPHGHDPEKILRAALSGGAGMIELRERDLPKSVIDRSGQTFRRIADTYSALFIVNDDPYLAHELHADGVHVGQDDMDPAEARAILGPDAIIGLSTHSPEQIEAAADAPVDYVSVGPIWETPTKAGRPATGLELISTAAESATVPWFAIG